MVSIKTNFSQVYHSRSSYLRLKGPVVIVLAGKYHKPLDCLRDVSSIITLEVHVIWFSSFY